MQLTSPAWWLIGYLKHGYGGWLEQNRGHGNPGKWAPRTCGRWCPHPLVPQEHAVAVEWRAAPWWQSEG